jgi:YbbR domain-containing protein
MWLTVPLEYRNMPGNMEIAGDLVNRVEVGIRGPRGVISRVTPEQIRAYVDLSQATRGLNYIRLTPENIQAPLGSEITKMTPSSVRIWLENVKTRSVQVKAQLVGKLPKTLRLITIWVEPPFVVLQGPESALARVREISTEAVDLSSIKENKKISVGLDIESPQVHLVPGQPSQVTVDIRVERAT